jgi:hypothetical protein
VRRWPPNKGMKQTKPGQNGAWQLIPSVGRTAVFDPYEVSYDDQAQSHSTTQTLGSGV